MKNNYRIILVSILLVLCEQLLIACGNSHSSAPLLTQQDSTIINEQYHPGNSRQYEASVQMTVFDGCLYFAPVSSPKEQTRPLYVLKNGKLEQVTQLSPDIMAMGDGYVYYSAVNSNSEWCLYCYDIAANEEVMLMPMERHVRGNSTDWQGSYLKEDGTYCFYANDTCYPIDGTQVGVPVQIRETHTIGSYDYYTDGRTLMRVSADGAPENLSETVPDGVKCMISCEDGLLVHNANNGNFLYYIEESGEIVELYSVPCIYAVSAVNVHGKDVFLSFKRFEKEGLFGSYMRFKNDTLEGTYRINLDDYSVEKISDEIYNGLFIFDDTGIYASDEDCHVYKLDFDGNVISSLIE